MLGLIIGGSVYVGIVVSAAVSGAVKGAWSSGTRAHARAVQTLSQAQERVRKTKEL